MANFTIGSLLMRAKILGEKRGKIVFFWGSLCGLILLGGCSPTESGLENGKSVLRIATDMPSFQSDILKSENPKDGKIYNALLDTLVFRDMAGKIQPSLAQSWTIADQGRRYTFSLRKQAMFSNGKPILAKDVVYTFQSLIGAKKLSSFWHLFSEIENAKEVHDGTKEPKELGVVAVNDYTVRFSLKGPVPAFLKILSHYSAGIRSSQQQRGTFVGSGPYRLAEVKKDLLVLRKSKFFWDQENVQLDKVLFLLGREPDEAYAAYKKGQVDVVMMPFPLEQSQREKGGDSELTLTPALTSYFLLLNGTQPFLKDIKVRKALSLAIDRGSFEEGFLSRVLRVSYGLVPQGFPSYPYGNANLETKEGSYQQRLTKARNLMKEAGFSEKKPLRLIFSILSDPLINWQVKKIVSNWKDIFVEATVDSQDSAMHYEKISKGETQVAWVGLQADFFDPSLFLIPFVPKVPGSYLKTKEPDVERLIEQSFRIGNTVARMNLLSRAEKILLEERRIIPLSSAFIPILHKPYVHGFENGRNTTYPLRAVSVKRPHS